MRIPRACRIRAVFPAQTRRARMVRILLRQLLQRANASEGVDSNMSNNQFRLSCLAASLAMAFMINAHAQTSSSTTPAASGNMAMAKSNASSMSHSDRKFMEKAAQGGMAEVELGQIAAQKAQDPQVKQFAQRMVDDHSKANDKLKQVAASKNMQLPSDVPSSERREADKLNKLSGD